MPISAIVFDIGGVLEITPRTGWEARWESLLGLQQGEIYTKLRDTWRAGDIGKITEQDVERRLGEVLGLSGEQVAEFMGDLWKEYLGELNTELAAYFAGLRPRFKTGILSNSFVGAREKEQAAYGFGDMCDTVIYSHEEGMKKPDPRFFELACRRLEVQPQQMIFVDDVPEAIEAARRFGIHGILFRDNAQTISEIEATIVAETNKPGL